jgi:hypothetical protein
MLRAASDDVPLVVVLDDLHWADGPTLRMLTHVAREIARSRLLVVGTYRDTDLDRTHPLTRALADLNREQLFQRIPLRGLTRSEVEAYLQSATGSRLSSALVQRVYEETEGNPFFLAEFVNLMVQEDGLGDSTTVPEGVREALGRRLDHLSAECNELLGVAAVAGREFGYDLLARLADYGDESLLRLIEEALEARVIEEASEPGRYRFTHALMQETLLSELSITRQVRLHGAIAEALVGLYGERAERHAAELAHHFAESATLSRTHAEDAIGYCRVAAQLAERQIAWDEAARHYERALATLRDLGDAPPLDEAELLASLGHSQIEGTAVGREIAFPTLHRAIDLFAQAGERERAAETALDALCGDRSPLSSERLPFVEKGLEAASGVAPKLEAQLLTEQSIWDSTEPASAAAVRAAELIDRHHLTSLRTDLDLATGSRALIDGRVADAVRPLQEAFGSLEAAGELSRAATAMHLSRGNDGRRLHGGRGTVGGSYLFRAPPPTPRAQTVALSSAADCASPLRVGRVRALCRRDV